VACKKKKKGNPGDTNTQPASKCRETTLEKCNPQKERKHKKKHIANGD
jgi:hypothetical protein